MRIAVCTINMAAVVAATQPFMPVALPASCLLVPPDQHRMFSQSPVGTEQMCFNSRPSPAGVTLQLDIRSRYLAMQSYTTRLAKPQTPLAQLTHQSGEVVPPSAHWKGVASTGRLEITHIPDLQCGICVIHKPAVREYVDECMLVNIGCVHMGPGPTLTSHPIGCSRLQMHPQPTASKHQFTQVVLTRNAISAQCRTNHVHRHSNFIIPACHNINATVPG